MTTQSGKGDDGLTGRDRWGLVPCAFVTILPRLHVRVNEPDEHSMQICALLVYQPAPSIFRKNINIILIIIEIII
jgi:hypothetical protein